ncbi:MAG: Flp pilus assembly complex ATPase component TadA [Candidatus Latescibacteria bacterium]|nr:Flp pilus assembly complex ATPase component TadA [Candidatus Latescibacterota bacterium]
MSEANTSRKKLGEYLLEAGLINEQQLKEALRRQRQTHEPLGHVLARQGMVTEADICRVLHQQLGLPIVDLQSIAIDDQVIALVREDLAKKYTAIPIELENRSTVRVAMADPLNAQALEDIRFQSGYFVRPVLAPPSEISEAISKYYHIDASVVEILEHIIKNDPIAEVREIVAPEGDESLDELMKVSAGPPIVRLANWLITKAVEMRASDIHIEPQEKALGVRCRVDGLLQDLERLPKWTQGALVSRVKILAALDIAEKRLPQDGSFRVELDGRRVDLRVSTLPTAHGEKVVIRIVDQERSALHLDSLGLTETGLTRIRAYGRRPQGIVIVTGPTGSGKSTLLYSLLQQIHTVTKNIITVEDPIEYQIGGINQVQVDEKSKKTFAAILRAMLRQDPDIMMIGEVRDLETAQIAFRASITGHLVLSTVHTNDAPSAVTRLVDLGLQPYMVASSMIAVISMRLVRLLCPKCKDQYVPAGDELRILGLTAREAQSITLHRPVGCDYCGQSGYRGRTGIFEILELDDSLRRLIASGAAESLIRAAAIEAGMTPIGEDGLAKVLAGETSLEELRRVVFYEEEAGRVCATCHETVASEYHYCPHCGHPVTTVCLKCDRRVDPSWGYCPGCGTRRDPAVEAEAPDELVGGPPSPVSGRRRAGQRF